MQAELGTKVATLESSLAAMAAEHTEAVSALESERDVASAHHHDQLSDAQQALVTSQQELTRVQAELGTKVATLESSLAAMEAERTEAVSALESELAAASAQYDKMVSELEELKISSEEACVAARQALSEEQARLEAELDACRAQTSQKMKLAVQQNQLILNEHRAASAQQAAAAAQKLAALRVLACTAGGQKQCACACARRAACLGSEVRGSNRSEGLGRWGELQASHEATASQSRGKASQSRGTASQSRSRASQATRHSEPRCKTHLAKPQQPHRINWLNTPRSFWQCEASSRVRRS